MSGPILSGPIRRACVLVCLVTVLLGGGATAAAEPRGAAARAWIDTPLHGSVIPNATVDLLVHATDPAGVDLVQLRLDGLLVDEGAPGGGSVFVRLELTWTPPGDGAYLLEVRGRNTDGKWGASAWAFVTIGDGPGRAAPGSSRPAPSAALSASAAPSASGSPVAPTARPTPAATSRPTPAATPRPTRSPRPTPTPTPAPCTPAAPQLIAPSNGLQIRDPALNPPTLRWAYRVDPGPCPPTGFRIQVSRNSGFTDLVGSVDLGPSATSWTPADGLPDCTTYYWRVFPKRADRTLAPPTATWSFTLFIGRCT